MGQIQPFTDQRLAAFCAFCGGSPDSKDHVPPRIFLDLPHPENFPVIGACINCNRGASLDEEYAACLLEVAACGSVDPANLRRQKIARTLEERPAIAARLAGSLRSSGEFVVSQEDGVRLSAVLEKIARGLWAYEVGETAQSSLATVRYAQIAGLRADQLEAFMALEHPDLLPEVGSRMMIRVLTVTDKAEGSWIELQAGRFSYGIEVFSDGGHVKMVLGDYIAAEVTLVASFDS
jgi:hypothetical protein